MLRVQPLVATNTAAAFRLAADVETSLEGYEAACLNGGIALTVNTAIANLANRRLLRMDTVKRRLFAIGPKMEEGEILERVIHNTARKPEGAKFGEVHKAAKIFAAAFADKLKSAGLVVSDAQARKARIVPLIFPLAALTLGITKICVGLSRGKPVEILVVLCIISFVATLFVFARRPLRSRRGDFVLEQLKDRHATLRKPGSRISTLPANEFATAIGLFGLTALAGTELDDLQRTIRRASDGGSSGSSCGSSDGGGSGCGGGGGGCGGCGGGSN